MSAPKPYTPYSFRLGGTHVREFATETLEERLLRRSVVRPSGCREWIGALSAGYGIVTTPSEHKTLAVHRAAYLTWVGPIPEGLTIDHLCRNRSCIEPTHAVSIAVNVRRDKATQTHCKQGHEFSGTNLVIGRNGWRSCRICRQESWTRRRGRLLAAGLRTDGKPRRRTQ